jgi:hypothetical protein
MFHHDDTVSDICVVVINRRNTSGPALPKVSALRGSPVPGRATDISNWSLGADAPEKPRLADRFCPDGPRRAGDLAALKA